jgi:hypothetical protein
MLLLVSGLVLVSGIPAFGNVTPTIDDDVDTASIQVVASPSHPTTERVPHTELSFPPHSLTVAVSQQYGGDVPAVLITAPTSASVIARSRDPPQGANTIA